MNCKDCGSTIHIKRVQLGYKTCVDCSTTESYGFVNIINHKTGNTVQVMPKDQAAAINKIGDRKRFGTILRGGSKSMTYNPKKIERSGCSTSFIGSKEMFDKVGEQALSILNLRGMEAALSFVQKEAKDYSINGNQAFQIQQILQTMGIKK